MKIHSVNNINTSANKKNVSFGGVWYKNISRSERTAICRDVLPLLTNQSKLLATIADPVCRQADLVFEKGKDEAVKMNIIVNDNVINLNKDLKKKNPLTFTFQLVGKDNKYSRKYAIPEKQKPLLNEQMYQYEVHKNELSDKPMFEAISKFTKKIEKNSKKIISEIIANTTNIL